ncbi:MAG: hypothetical protein ACOCVM_07450, partial [Desulfovibrionaceae bacterium]
MSFFLLFSLVYFLMHALIWLRAGFQLDLSRRAKIVGWIVVLGLTATPFLGWRIPDHWPIPVIRAATWAVY